ncbi:glycosyltransferase [Thiolapillus brandeum]|uniref:Glycosyl transferase family 1 n=1 Tax=Thiolapillus brandeum TaxID=1076588 RepID=A0A7U6GKZ6_9GAMM|nr:glycosyltransferase [Thiolapillus brandeum]BAO45434.1 glycosyl transferase family 1 [Thiolapillus brandeum]
MRSRLLIITNLYPTPWENLRGTFNFQQFNHLAAHLDIRIIVPVSWKDRFKHRNSPAKKLLEHPLQGKVVYPLYWYTPGFFRGTYGWSMWASLQLQCRKLIADFNPDYLLSSWAYPEGVAGTRIAQSLGIPAFVKVHGSDVNITAQHPHVAPQIHDWGQKVAGVASVSHDLKKKLKKLGVPESRIHVIYNGIDHQRFHPMADDMARKSLHLDNAPFLLYVGDLKARKGCMDLLLAFLKLEKKYPRLKLYIAGTGVMQIPLQQHIEQAGVANKVQLLGKVQHADLNQWYNAASLTCLPSYNEGVPNVLLESMACGTPVVATGIGGIPEVVNSDCGLLTEPGDIEALAQKLDNALEKNWNQERIHQHASGFSWEENTRKMLDMFRGNGDPLK